MTTDQIEKLKQKLEALNGDRDDSASNFKKVNTLSDLAFAVHRSDPEQSEEYARKGLILAE